MGAFVDKIIVSQDIFLHSQTAYQQDLYHGGASSEADGYTSLYQHFVYVQCSLTDSLKSPACRLRYP